MVRGVRWYLVGSLVLVMLAGCGRGFLQFAEREKWRREAEVACLRSGTVKESVSIVRIQPIEGPGVCGADFPLKVAALSESGALGFAQEPIRPPASVPGVPGPRWPIAPSHAPAPQPPPPSPRPLYAPSNAPLSLEPPGGGHADAAPGIDQPPLRAPITSAPLPSRYSGPTYSSPQFATPAPDPAAAPPPAPALGPLRGPPVAASFASVQIKPMATLACPIVSALDRWIAGAVQPAALRWFGQPVVEIKQISAYSCRGMNGQAGASISEHAFGNALDIAAFVLADGRRVTIKDGWRGAPEEQGFLRDIQGAACDQFTTVLAPGSNAFHYDHIHVDLMRRASGRRICQPGAVDGELIAAQARRNPALAARRSIPPTRRYDPPFDARNDPFAWRGDARRGDPDITGSITARRGGARHNPAEEDNDWVEDPGPRIRLE
jgi:hypothetical protein